MTTLKLSHSILTKIPPNKRKNRLKNLQWAARNLMLSNSERTEVNSLLDVMKKSSGGQTR